MSLFDQIKSAATEAESVLAELGGAKPGKKNFTLNGTTYLGVIEETVAQMPGTATNIETIRELRIVATRTQFTAKPDATSRPIVGAMGTAWHLTAVGESGIHYFLTCHPA